jgi:hypothetical protein
MNLKMEERTLRRKFSTRAKIKVAEHRQRLTSRIRTFQDKADVFWNQADENLTFTPEADQNDGEDDDDDDDDDEWRIVNDDLISDEGSGEEVEDSDIDSDEPQPAEKTRLLMPSTLGSQQCVDLGKTTLMEQEIQLRVGQANDALAKLRLALAHKSMVFRLQIRVADSQSTKTRAWDNVKTATATVNNHVRTYRLAHQALLNLNAGQEQFQTITPKDLKMAADVVEENRYGQKNDTLPWIWRIGFSGEEAKRDNWLQECKIRFLHCFDCI